MRQHSSLNDLTRLHLSLSFDFLRHQSPVGYIVPDYLHFFYLSFGAHGYTGVNRDSVGDSAGFAEHGSEFNKMVFTGDPYRSFLAARGESSFNYATLVNN